MASVPTIDYTSRDYLSLRTSMLQAATDPASPLYVPGWSASAPGDFGVALVEMFAYMGDILSYYADRVANESFLSTATLRSNVVQLARLLGYNPHGPLAAQTTVQFTAGPGFGTITIPAGTQVSTAYIASLDAPLIFETVDDLVIALSGTGNTTAGVTAVQGQTVSNESLGVSDGTQDQVFALANAPVIDGSWTVKVGAPDPTTGVMVYTTYIYYPRIADAGPTSRAYTTYYDDNGVLWVQFGDGINGAIPASGTALQATYRVGGGAIGNVEADTITNIVSSSAQVGIISVTSGAATGGADMESIDVIRTNAPLAFATQQRGVNLSDFIGLAQSDPGVVRANATSSAGSPSVIVYIVPSGGGAPSASVMTRVQADLQRKALSGYTVTVNPPTYVGIDVSLALGVLPNYLQADVKNLVTQTVQNFFGYANTHFGETVRVGDIYAAILAVPGVDYATISVMARTGGSGTADIVLAANEFPTPNVPTVNATGGV